MNTVELARAAGVHPLAMSEEYISGLERFAAVFQQQIERLTLNGIHSCHAECQRPVCRLTRERDALLEACRFYAEMMGRRQIDGRPFYMAALNLDCGDRARAAIKQAEGETK